LNRRILAIEGVVDAVVFAPENDADRLAAMVVAPELKSSDILDGLRLEVESVFLPRPVYMVPNLPRQETGKLANRDVIKLFGDMMKTKSSEKQEP
jgi:acyl-coenzyme A synthetase/AMP-(fatty) acid ligase